MCVRTEKKTHINYFTLVVRVSAHTLCARRVRSKLVHDNVTYNNRIPIIIGLLHIVLKSCTLKYRSVIIIPTRTYYNMLYVNVTLYLQRV